MGGQVSRAGVGVQSRQYSLGHFTRILDILLGSTEEEALASWAPTRGSPSGQKRGAWEVALGRMGCGRRQYEAALS